MADLYNRIDTLCKERSISVTVMCKDAGVSRASLSDLKMGRNQTLSTETLSKIAVYFGVSVDSLLGKEKAPTNGERDVLDEVDVAFYGDFKELNEDEKETVRDMVRLMRQRKEKRSQ